MIFSNNNLINCNYPHKYLPLEKNNFIKIIPCLAILSCLLVTQNAISQVKLVVTAGVGKSSLYKFPYLPVDADRYSANTAFWGGLAANFSFLQNNTGVFTSLTYNNRGYNYLMENTNGTINSIEDSSFKQSLNYLSLNVNARRKFNFGNNNTFFVGTGPVANLMLGGTEKTNVNYFGNTPPPTFNNNTKLVKGSVPGSYRPFYISWGFNVGFEIQKFAVWFNYDMPLDAYYSDTKKAIKHKIKTYGINVSYNFYTHKTKKTKKVEKIEIEEKIKELKIDSTKDSDGDGILDYLDKCLGHKGVAKYQGCPVPDTDGDGINDDDDNCITIFGTKENKGCPTYFDSIATKIKDTAIYIIYFEPAKSILKGDAYRTLDIILDLMKKNPKLQAIIKGHTDYAGNEAANFARSLGRASVCADYLESYKIKRNRLSVISLGNTQPAADLKDPLVQWRNRRVEIFLFEVQKNTKPFIKN